MLSNLVNKDIRIFQVFNSRTVNGKVIYLARTINHVYKFFEVEKQIPWVKLVACIHADESSDEVLFLGKIEDFNVVKENYSGLSGEDIDMIKKHDYTIIDCYRSGINYQMKKIVLGDKFKQRIIRDYKDKYGYDIEINGNFLTEIESKVIQYMEEEKKYRQDSNHSDYWRIMSISNLEKIYNDIREKVNSLNIESIIDSYHVTIDSNHINKVGGDDTYFDYYVSECEYTDEYISNFLRNMHESVHGSFDPHYPSSFQEQQKWWENCKKMESSNKKWIRKEYNKEQHIYVLFAHEVRRRIHQCSSKEHDYELLKQYVSLTWGLDYIYMPIDNNLKNMLAKHNKGRNAIF